MLGILVVGSVALDDVETPFGRRTRTLGGACTYFSTAASLYTQVSVVAVVGSDFPDEHVAFLASRGIDLTGLQSEEGKTFSWSGRYGSDLGDATTLDTQLNVFAHFHPAVPTALRDTEHVFLANIDPELQIEVLRQMHHPRLRALDSMNYWIRSKRASLIEAISMVDVVFLNESEAWQLTGEPNMIKAARMVLDLGPGVLVLKKGAHGAMLVTRGRELCESLFLCPAYPLEAVVDPTGAGDTFAAGFMGYVARNTSLSLEALRRAVVHGNVMASFTVQDFSIDRLRTLSLADVQARYDELRRLTHFEPLQPQEATVFQRQIR